MSGPKRSPGRPRAAEGLDTRAELLAVARALFSANGYAGTSVSEVGKGAGVSVPVIYQRFGSKAGLFVATGEDVYDVGLARLRASIDGLDDFDAALDAALREFVAISRTEPDMTGMVVMVLIEAERRRELAADLKPMLREFRSFCDAIAALAPESRAPGARGKRNLALALESMFSGLMVSSTLSKPADFRALVDAMRHLVVPS